MSEIIRKRKLRLEPEEELALIERVIRLYDIYLNFVYVACSLTHFFQTKGAPKVKDLMVGGTYEEQVIKVVHRPNQR